MSIYASLLTAGTKIEAAARDCVKIVRNALGHLTGDQQHAAAVNQLLTLFPDLAKWAAHALISLAFGWLEKNSPASLQTVEQAIEGGVQGQVDNAITKASVTLTSQPAPSFAQTPILQPAAPVGEYQAGGSPQSPTSQTQPSLLSQVLGQPSLGQA